MTTEAILADFRSLVSQMMKEKGIEEYDVDLTGNSNIGDGYMGDIIFFKITTKENGKTLDLVMKIAKKNEVLRTTTNLEENFNRELFMYNKVFKTIDLYFSKKKPSVKVLEYVPKLFWSCGDKMKESLVFQNLKTEGFTSWKKGKTLDFENTKMVVRNIAKLHGEVMAFRDQNPEEFESWIPKLQNIRYELLVQLGLMEHAYKNFRTVVQLLEKSDQHDLAAKFKPMEANLDRYAQVPIDEKDRITITHADLWINNILFKFSEKSDVAIANKYFDFQVANISTPIEDLSFFIYGQCDKDVLDKIDDLMKDYHDTLISTLKNLGTAAEKMFTYAQLEEHWRKYGMFGVISSTEILKLQLLTDEEIIMEIEREDTSTCYNFVMKNEDLYLQRLVTLFTHFGNRFL